jgi:PAS domain S-box-containing protein
MSGTPRFRVWPGWPKESENVFMSDPSYHVTSTALHAAQMALASAAGTVDALENSELRYRRLFEAARDGILILDGEHGRITAANPFMTELLGYSHAELLGKELWEIGLLRDKGASQEAFRRLEREGYIRYEDLPLQNRRGERREVEFVSNLYREKAYTLIQCNIRDTTERRLVAAQLADAAAKNERIAETLQRSMLIESPEGKFPGVAVKTLYEAALHERVALVVGDVSGKGLAAAGRTAEVKYALRALLHEYPAPETALAHLNDFICETHRLDADSTEVFIVLALAVVDSVTGEAVFSTAGAEPTLILRSDGRAEPVEITGLPLGIRPGALYEAKTTRLACGETVLMGTDGITEARHGRAFLGTDGLAALAMQTGPSASLQELSHGIYCGARAFAGGKLRDDVCLLLARRQ